MDASNIEEIENRDAGLRKEKSKESILVLIPSNWTADLSCQLDLVISPTVGLLVSQWFNQTKLEVMDPNDGNKLSTDHG